MKVTIVNHSDTRGGASVVSYRLLKALVAAGVDARMLVVHKGTDNLRVEQLTPQWRYKECFLREHAQIFLHNGLSYKNLFKASIANCGMSISQHPWIEEADCVLLNWVNQGMLSLDEISRIQAPVIWTMHDMWCMTGVCHHAGECERFQSQCGRCKLLHGGTADNDLSRRTWISKQKLYSRKDIAFVPVSNWLADKCRQSSLLGHEQIVTIPNAFNVDDFTPEPSMPRSKCGLPKESRLIAMGAARLDDPIKGLDLAISALNQLQGTDAAAVFFGNLRNPKALEGLAIPHVWLGPVNSQQTLHDIYAHAAVVLSSSHYETLPGTLIEGMASGCVPVTFGQGGQSDIVDHLKTGYIARHPDTDDLANGLKWALAESQNPQMQQQLRNAVKRKFAAEAVANKYIALINSLINK